MNYNKITPTSSLVHSNFSDLVNNFVHYHNAEDMQGHENKVWSNRPPAYTNYKTLESLLPEIIANPQQAIDAGSIPVRCPVSQFYTCDAKLTGQDQILGYDRLWKYKEIMSKASEYIKTSDGYSAKADLLHGMVRWIFDKNDKVIGITIVKDRGNLRSHIALESNGGQDVNLAITLDFHECDPTLSESEMRAIEAETFTEDAVDRRGFDQETKFRAGYIANRPKQLAQYGWLNEQNVDFGGVVTKERLVEGKTPPKYSLSSLSKLGFGVDGKPYEDFARYGMDNINAAVGTAIKIHDTLNLQCTISVTLIHVFTRTFYFMTENSSKFKVATKDYKKAMWGRDSLQKYLVWYYTKSAADYNEREVVIHNLAEIVGRSGADKDLSWRAFDTYLPSVLEQFREDQGRVNRVGPDHPAIKAYINTIETEALKRQAKSGLDLAA